MATDIETLIRQIAKRQGLTAAQTAALLATAKVESGLDPNAVGDNGTSYGLFQMHVGGAGGATHQSARRYLDPTTAIQNRARFFRQNNITNGSGAAKLQRPADPNGYAAKVNAALKGLGGSLNAPVTSLGMGAETPGLAAAAPAKPSRMAAIDSLQSVRDRLAPAEEIEEGAPAKPKVDLGARTASLRAATDAAIAAKAQPVAAEPAAAPVSVKGGGPASSAYKDILEFGAKQFGLRIDGSNQTTGGKHTAGSLHYSGRAVDFGDAKNDPAKLRALAAWARANRSRVKEFYYDPLGWYIKDGKVIKGSIGGHGDHVHIAL